jgi:hypothetical protein
MVELIKQKSKSLLNEQEGFFYDRWVFETSFLALMEHACDAPFNSCFSIDRRSNKQLKVIIGSIHTTPTIFSKAILFLASCHS